MALPAEPVNITDVNWIRIYQGLCITVARRTRGRPVDGRLPDDFVSDAFLAFFLSENALGWNPVSIGLEDFLIRVLAQVVRFDLLDAYRRDRKPMPLALDMPGGIDLEFDCFVKEVMDYVRRGASSSEEGDVLDRFLAGEKNQEIAKHMGLPSNRTHGLMRHLKAKAYAMIFRSPGRKRKTHNRKRHND